MHNQGLKKKKKRNRINNNFNKFSLITSRIDISIINHLKPTMVKAKSNVVKVKKKNLSYY